MREERALAEEKNHRTADRFEAMLRLGIRWREDSRTTLVDLLSDALHYCRDRELPFDDVLAEARERFEDDILS